MHGLRINLHLTPLNVCSFILALSSESTKTLVLSLWQTFKYVKPVITCSFKILSLGVNVTDSFKQFSDYKIFIASPILIASFRISWCSNASIKIAQSSKLCVQLYCLLLCQPAHYITFRPVILSPNVIISELLKNPSGFLSNLKAKSLHLTSVAFSWILPVFLPPSPRCSQLLPQAAISHL